MKIALVTPGGLDRSGRERVMPALLWLVERLARNHDVKGVTLHQYPDFCRYALLGAEIVNLSPPVLRLPGLDLLHQTQQLLRFFRAENWYPDVLHAIWASDSGRLAVLAGRLLGKPSLVSPWGGEMVFLPEIGYGGQRSWRSRLGVNWCLHNADAITVGSRHVQRSLEAVRPDAHWLPLGVEAGLYAAPVERMAGPPWRLIHVAHINPVKDQATLLQALLIVKSEGIDFRLDWFGEDTLNGRLQKMAQELGLERNIVYHGVIPIDQVIPFYFRAHLFIQSSLHESQGVAVCEAAMAGVPAVGTSVGLVAELAPQAAVATPTGDAPALAAAILSLLADPARREALGRSARAWAQAYDADWTAAQFEDIYRELVGERSRL